MITATTCILVLTYLTLFAVKLADPSLSLHISVPQIVNGVGDLKVIVTTTNTGNETLKLLQDSRRLLRQMSVDKFVISNSASRKPSFIGIDPASKTSGLDS